MEVHFLKYRTVLIHVAVWPILFILPHLFFDGRRVQPGFFPGSWFVITNLYNVGLFYLNAFLLYPNLLNKNKWWLYILSIAAVLIASYYLKLWLTQTFYPAVILDNWAHRILFFPSIPFIVASIIYRLVVDKIAHDKKQKEIIAEQLSIKLKFLRSQMSPHFIFNVLTNLVSLARKQSRQLEPALIMLSDLMRYMLYESDEKKVPIAKELEYVQSYISLQQLRFGEDVKIDVVIDLPQQIRQATIEPMLLIPFVENAFKHGTGADDPFIEIHLSSNKNELALDVKNKFIEYDKSKDANSGIGLENVQSRLALLYEGKHQLLIKKEADIFHVHLTFQLSL
ncbi:MAG TPA: histidine kinase [Parafilimonas sp.]|nr:histidine kinase [Parafilimonas sp.]